MKLNEMKQNFNTNHRVENSISNWGDVCKTIYEDHQDIVKKKCEKVYSHSGYMDKEDIMQDGDISSTPRENRDFSDFIVN